jgi:hypothetical protein
MYSISSPDSPLSTVFNNGIEAPSAAVVAVIKIKIDGNRKVKKSDMENTGPTFIGEKMTPALQQVLIVDIDG